MKQVVTDSPAKCIITGEHSVVFGQPAVVTAIVPGVTARLYQGSPAVAAPHLPLLQKLLTAFTTLTGADTHPLTATIKFHIPVGSGLGASAAIGHAISKSLFKWFNLPYTSDDLFNLVQQGEQLAHHRPSGVDAAAVIHGGLIHFVKQGETARVERLTISSPTPIKGLLIQSGKPTESTAEMVQHVARQLAAKPQMHQVITELGDVSRSIMHRLMSGKIDLAAIQLNHHLLAKLGVVDQVAQQMISEVAAMGGAAKISGAGGRTNGSGMIIAFHPNIDQLTQFVQQKGWQWWSLTLPGNN